MNCRQTRKLFTIYGALHPKSDVDRLYIPRKEGRRGLISIQDCVELAIRGLEEYVHGSEERWIQAAAALQIVVGHQSLPTIWVTWSVKIDADFLK